MGGRGPKAEHLSQIPRRSSGGEDRKATMRVDRELAEDDWPTVSEQLRDNLSNSHLTISALARGAGIQCSQVRAFLRGAAGMSVHTLDRICRYMGFVLVEAEDSE